jgi:hypothetical protein
MKKLSLSSVSGFLFSSLRHEHRKREGNNRKKLEQLLSERKELSYAYAVKRKPNK